jgi:hypothetical protein
MRFWFRELAGWLLVGIGLIVFYLCFDLLVNNHAILQTGPLLVIGIIVFRGGIHLLKVAVAARICQQAQERPVATPRKVTRPTASTGKR